VLLKEHAHRIATIKIDPHAEAVLTVNVGSAFRLRSRAERESVQLLSPIGTRHAYLISRSPAALGESHRKAYPEWEFSVAIDVTSPGRHPD
jgi:hypothetical protein